MPGRTSPRALVAQAPVSAGAVPFRLVAAPRALDRDTAVRDVNTGHGAPSNQRATEAREDRELVAAARRGDRDAFRRLVERHQRRAFAIALGVVHDEHDAREVVQEAFLRVWKGLDRWQGDSAFFTWLYRIVANLAIDLVRRPGRREADREVLVDPDDLDELELPLAGRLEGGGPLDALHRREIGARLRAALDALPPYHRGVILMREVEGMSYDEMAQAMGVSKGTIMSRLFHARQKLQRALGEYWRELAAGAAVVEAPSEEGAS
jgi:RNA polymerase sigma-70 factor (ECF subfamily)